MEPQHDQITLRRATEEVIENINDKIAAQAAATLEMKRYISLNDVPPGYNGSSNIYFYSNSDTNLAPTLTTQKTYG